MDLIMGIAMLLAFAGMVSVFVVLFLKMCWEIIRGK